MPTRLWGPAGDVVVRLAPDTGATATLLNWDVLVLLGYDPAVTKKRIQITTGSGVEFVPRIPIERIEAMGKEQRDLQVVCHTLPPTASVDGLLDLDFFRGQRLIVDFRAGLVTVD